MKRYIESGAVMKSFENIEKIFLDDIREKKKTGRGSFHMRGKGVKHGFRGALRTPYHFMKNKEKNQLNGKVEVYNMYETIIPVEEFRLKDLEIQKKMLIRWREIYENKKICAEMQISNMQKYYDLVNELGVPTRGKTGGRTGKVKTTKKVAAIQPNQVELLMIEQPERLPEKQPENNVIIFNGLNLEINGEYSPDQLNKIFTKMQLLVDGEENKYKFSLTLVEMG